MAAIDPITLEVYWNRLVTIMDETDRTLMRTAFSSIVAEGRDFAVILLDENGVSLAQSVLSTSMFTCMLPRTVRHLLKKFPLDTLREGDVLLTNNPWIGTGHLPDLCVVCPVFYRGKVVAHIASAAHIADIGGTKGYFEGRDLYEEGLHLPPCKIYKAGEPSEEILEIIRANVRVPDQVIGDLRAILAAEHVGAERLREFLGDYGLPDLRQVSADIQERSEQAMRNVIEQIPDGVYRHSTVLDGLGDPVTIAVTVTVSGSSMRVDYTGTSPETRKGAINNTYHATLAGTFISLKAALTPEIPNNESLIRPIEIYAPEGCILNCRYPAPVKGRSAVSLHLFEPLFAALAPALPRQVVAGGGGFWGVIAMGEQPDGTPFNAHLILNGGVGSSFRKDGLMPSCFPSNAAISPTEVFEAHVPLFLEAKELREGSGGDGAFRGGLGQRLVMRPMNGTPVTVSLRPVQKRNACGGLLGGEPGALGRALLNGEYYDGLLVDLGPDDELIVETPGGGGYGDPQNRPAAMRDNDRQMGYTTGGSGHDRD